MREAREEALVDDVPGEECSVRMVVPWAMQALRGSLSGVLSPAISKKICR